ncbi:type II toxin-antitoxin system HicB family antitoxin [Plectonema cf. radiosum LEGE 06105]|uniref:Type II toxin-antitoxin system HicB family antitoxin n=1 Tax=Plectonema cf. radiosum LEGE 06105 TaxID=945769 RepID=A0A8J7FA66_9CYAN|nr:type II toxin-antitoxin system HicB family antitoxin [Plectonema radiosum]MBE9214504.1 type II toxin-antitoxin system HicB family antitoxin [Plectonema cf. radiosum LEGE 06105]
MVSLSLSKNYEAESSKLTYGVLIEQEQDGQFSASVLGLSDYKSLGKTEDEAVSKLQQILQERLKNSKILTLEIESTPDEDSWKNIFGMHKDNPLFDEVLAEIEAERAKLDAKMEEYYKQIDDEQG